MGRPKIERIVRELPDIKYFVPHGVPESNIVDELLSIVEYESLRLKHFEKLNQVKCAEKMQISKFTFSRILDNAHVKITSALVQGKAFKIEGGKFGIMDLFVGYGCSNSSCLHEWKIKIDKKEVDINKIDNKILAKLLPLPPKSDITCPKCGSVKLYRLKRDLVINSKKS